MTAADINPLRFVASPPQRGSYNWQQIAQILRDNPGKWLLAFKQERYSIAVAIRNGSIVAMAPDRGIRVITRNNNIKHKPRRADIYLSYQPALDKYLEQELH